MYFSFIKNEFLIPFTKINLTIFIRVYIEGAFNLNESKFSNKCCQIYRAKYFNINNLKMSYHYYFYKIMYLLPPNNFLELIKYENQLYSIE